jgi:hypothetical protein
MWVKLRYLSLWKARTDIATLEAISAGVDIKQAHSTV